MTKQELEENYRNFNNARIRYLATDPNGLSDLALEVLEEEIQRRELEVKIQLPITEEDIGESPFNIYNRDKPTFEDITTESEDLSNDISNGAKIFKTSSFSLVKVGLLFIGLGVFMIYVAINMMKLDNIFGVVTVSFGLTFVILAILILRGSSKNQITLHQEKIEFQHRRFIPGGRGSIIDLLRLVFSSKRTVIKKEDIKSINMPAGFFRYSLLHFELKNGTKYEINFLGDKEELEYVHAYISKYLNS